MFPRRLRRTSFPIEIVVRSMTAIVADDGRFTQDGTRIILNYIRALEDGYICCSAPNLQMEPRMYHLQATTITAGLLDPLQHGYPVALTVCQSCGEVRNYSLRVIFGDSLASDEQVSPG